MGDIINLNKENAISEKTEYKEIIDTANTLIDEVELDNKEVKLTIPFVVEGFRPDTFEVETFAFDTFEPDGLDIKFLRRGGISVSKIGYA